MHMYIYIYIYTHTRISRAPPPRRDENECLAKKTERTNKQNSISKQHNINRKQRNEEKSRVRRRHATAPFSDDYIISY